MNKNAPLTPTLSPPRGEGGFSWDVFTPGGPLLRLPGANFSLPLQGGNLS